VAKKGDGLLSKGDGCIAKKGEGWLLAKLVACQLAYGSSLWVSHKCGYLYIIIHTENSYMYLS
jgi:hypothetical protein